MNMADFVSGRTSDSVSAGCCQEDGDTVSWVQLCKDQLCEQLREIEARVQRPPAGPIQKADLLWELRRTPQNVRGKDVNYNQKGVVTQECFIPTDRLEDFVQGMEISNGGIICKFRRIRTKDAKDLGMGLSHPTATKDVSSYHCQYGPEDHSGLVKIVTATMLPVPRRKVLLETTMYKKKRGRPKKLPLRDTAELGTDPQTTEGEGTEPAATSDGLSPEVAAVKPKRGRPKKVVTDAPSQEVAAVKPKRGRPKKVVNESPQQEVAAVKPKRGRPKKVVSESTTLEVALVKPKRGRPKKVVSESTTLEEALVKPKRGRPKKGATEVMSGLREDATRPTRGRPKKLIPRDTNALQPNVGCVRRRRPQTTIGASDSGLGTEYNKEEFIQQSETDQAVTVEATGLDLQGMELRQTQLLRPIRHFDLNAAPPEEEGSLLDAVGEDVRVSTVLLVDSGTATTSAISEDVASERDVQPAVEQRAGTNQSNMSAAAARPKKPRDSMKQWGGSLKRGCLASFSVKTLLLLPHVTLICTYEAEHVNKDHVQCHGVHGGGDRSAFAWHLSPVIKDFVLALLRNGFSVSQIMTKHIAAVKDAIRDQKGLTRDMFLHERDVRNWATKVAKETYMLHSDDARSVQLWVQENGDSVFYYKETGGRVVGALTPESIPFTIGIQTPWQREMMIKFGHEGAVSIDATFGTNDKKFPLYTLMVFDEWHNGIPVAYIVTARSAQEDLTPWMRALEDNVKKERPLWKPNAFVVDCAQGEINSLRLVWPRTAIFLCLWHIHRAWQKQACIKIADAGLRAAVIRGLGAIMYDRGGLSGTAATGWAIQKLRDLQNSYPAANEFWDYVTQYWLPKVHMWVVGYRNLPYSGQDTNAAIEKYHCYMKSVLKSERSRLTGRRVDWCIHILTGDVLTHYWYQQVRKSYGFVDNRVERNIVLCALIQAHDIPDSDVTLPEYTGGPAYVTSTSHRHLRYDVHNPAELWSDCNCVHSQRGNTCKHKVKVLRMLRPDLAEGTVARHCGALKGGQAGASAAELVSGRPAPESETADPTATFPREAGTADSATLQEGQTPMPILHGNPHYNLQMQAKELLDMVIGIPILMDHLQSDFTRSLGKMKRLVADINSGVIHPGRTNPVFHCVQDGFGMRLSRLKDMLEQGRRPPAARRLWSAGDSTA